VADIIAGKTFDNGVLCSCEQAILCEEPLREAVLHELREQGAYFLNAQEIDALGKLVIRPDTFLVNPKVVGRPAPVIAEMAGFKVPPATRVLVGELAGVGREHPLSAEKLSPILAFYAVRNLQDAIELANRLLAFGGLGHTISIHSKNDAVVREFAAQVRAYRVVVNSPASLGSVGYSTGLFPSMTLGCGAVGGNSTSDNIGPQHLMNLKRLAYEIRPVETVAAPPPIAAVQPEPVAATANPAPLPSGFPDRHTIARVVERFLAQKGVPRSVESPSAPSLPSIPAPSPAPPAAASVGGPTSKPVDFVSESDVRRAVERAEKIFISPRTIVTPSARDLAGEHDIFVETAAPAASGSRRD
jgi:acetaldehyde dehydrogenase (acetylating)